MSQAYQPLHHKYRPQRFDQLVGQDAIAATLGHALRSDRIAPAYLFSGPRGTGERDAAKAMAADRPGAHQTTIGADKNYDTKGFVAEMRRIGMTPHVAQNTARPGGSAIDGRTTRHEGYAKSINARRGIEKVFGWIK